MTNEKSLPSSQREFERGFGWTLLLSAVGHLLILAALVVAPGFALRPQSELKSYSVDLVDPSKLGGTNLVAGSKGKSAEPPKVEPAKAKAPEPPPPPEPPKAEPPPPPEEVKAPEPPPPPKQDVKPPEPPKQDDKAIALDKKAEATPTRPQEVAKVEVPTVAPIPPTVKPEPTVAKVEPTKPKATVAKVAPTATQAKAAAKPQATPTKAPAQAVAKAQTSPGAKTNTTPGAKPNATPAKPTTPGKGAAPASAKVTPGGDNKGDSEKARDDRIAAAIKRVQEQAGTRGGGSGGGGSGESPGGPISMGPGEGAGGEVRSLATIMYTNRITAMIKDKWVWAGAKNLKADIAFRILPTGDVADVRTASSSGDSRYDRLAETAVRAASPFPAPPAECAEEFETSGFLYTFEPE